MPWGERPRLHGILEKRPATVWVAAEKEVVGEKVAWDAKNL